MPALLFAGPPDAEKVGLMPSTFLELTDAQLTEMVTQAQALLKAVFTKADPKDVEPTMDPVGWYNKKKELCQIRWGGKIAKKEFDACFEKSRWKVIPTPDFYVTAMHLPAEVITCYDGAIEKHPAHVLWLESYGQFMIIVEIKNA